MRKFSALLPLAFLCGFGTAFAQDAEVKPPPPLDPVSVRAVIEQAVDGFIRPGYDGFHDSAEVLDGKMRALCATPSAAAMADAKAGFVDATHRWSRIEIVRVGPVIEQNRFERVLYYPDKKGLGLKQVQRYLSEKDESVTTAEGLRAKSVAAQGLGALEYVLYGTGSDDILTEKNGFRCRYGAAIAGNIANIGAELASLWDAPDGVAKSWKEPGADNPVFRDEREAVVALLGILVHASEVVRDQRIETFYKGPDNAKFPRAAIYWRSGLTWNSIRDNVAAVQDLIQTAKIADLLPPDQRWLMDTINFLMKSIVQVAGTIEPDIEKALDDYKERGKVNYLLLNSKDLITRINDEYGGAIGLTSGFSFSDGD